MTGIPGNRAERLCAYCGKPGAEEDDHVIARQFFPPEERFRANLPQAPCCGLCNRAKQRVEDTAGVLFQLGHDSPASRAVLTTRVPRTLVKNRRLYRSLRKGLKEILVRSHGGILTPHLGITMDDPLLADSYAWFSFITRGLYCAEFGTPLPGDHTIYLLQPNCEQAHALFNGFIRGDSKHHERACADGEFTCLFARSSSEGISIWYYAFKSINVLAVTLAPGCPSDLRSAMDRVQWPNPTSTQHS